MTEPPWNQPGPPRTLTEFVLITAAEAATRPPLPSSPLTVMVDAEQPLATTTLPVWWVSCCRRRATTAKAVVVVVIRHHHHHTVVVSPVAGSPEAAPQP